MSVASSLLLAQAGEETVDRIADFHAEPDWMRAARHDGLRRAAELPVEPNQLFTSYVDLRAVRFADVDLYLEAGDAPDVSTTLPEGAAGLLAIDENRVVARALSPAAGAAGVVVDTIANALARTAVLAAVRESLAGETSLPADDKFAQLARALAVQAVIVHVPAGVQLERPLVIRWAAGAPGRGIVTRTLINLGEGATASVLEEQLPSQRPDSANGQSLWWGTTEVDLAAGAVLDFAAEQDFGPQTVAFVNRQASLERDTQLRWALASVGGLLQKSRIDNRLVGRGASVHQAEIAFGDGTQLFDLTSYTRHIGADTTGDLLSKGVFTDRSRGYFKGLIDIERTARGTDSFLGEFAMLLTRKARSVAIPSLEIDQPDVRRASHSSAVGPIDETQVFYLMSRGVPYDLARKFIVMGFLEPVVARIPLPAAQERLRELLEAKWPADPVERAGAAA